MNSLKKRVKSDLNEIIFCIYFLMTVILLPISNFVGSNVYKILFFVISSFLIILSLLKNKRILIKKDLILLSIILFSFIIDFLFRKNIYTVSTYIDICKVAFMSCYFYNRTTDARKIVEYFSFFYKLFILLFFFDPLFNYHFTDNYMIYGYLILLPGTISIYLDTIINNDKSNLVFLVFGIIGLIFFSNRIGIFSYLLSMILTIFFLRGKRKDKKVVLKNNSKEQKRIILKRVMIVILLFSVSFGINYIYAENRASTSDKNNDNWQIKNEEPNNNENDNMKNEIEQNINLSNKDDDMNLNFDSYSIDKYKEAFSGNFSHLFSGRVEIYKNALVVIKRDVLSNPLYLLFGRGMGYFRSLYNDVYTHNIFLDFIIQFGLIGLLLLISLFVYIIVKIRIIYKTEKYLYLLFVLMFCLSFPKLLLSSEFFKEMSFFILIIIVLNKFPLVFYKNNRKSNS